MGNYWRFCAALWHNFSWKDEQLFKMMLANFLCFWETRESWGKKGNKLLQTEFHYHVQYTHNEHWFKTFHSVWPYARIAVVTAAVLLLCFIFPLSGVTQKRKGCLLSLLKFSWFLPHVVFLQTVTSFGIWINIQISVKSALWLCILL